MEFTVFSMKNSLSYREGKGVVAEDGVVTVLINA